MNLYINPISPFCRAAAVYLREMRVPFEAVELINGADRARLLEISPYGEVPVLEVEHSMITGSQAICDFVDLEYSQPDLITSEPAARVACRLLEDIACSTTDALQFLVNLVFFRRPELAGERPSVRDRLLDAVREHYEFLDTVLGERSLPTRSYARADIFCFTMLSSLVFMNQTIPPKLAALTAWFGRMTSRPAITRDLERLARSAVVQAQSADPFFRQDRIHWRSHRIEWACRLELAPWLAREIERGRAFFSPAPSRDLFHGAGRRPEGPCERR